MSPSLDDIARQAPGLLLDVPQCVVVIGSDGRAVNVTEQRTPMDTELDAFRDAIRGNVIDGGIVVSELPSADVEVMVATCPPSFASVRPWSFELMAMRDPHAGVEVNIDAQLLAEFLNRVGRLGIEAGIDDLQMRPTVAAFEAGDDPVRTGFIADVDRTVVDPASEPFDRQAAIPLVAFSTENGGARFVYAYANRVSTRDDLEEKHRLFVGQVQLALRGVDPACKRLEQRQYVPAFWRTTKGPRRRVERIAIQTSTSLIDLQTVRAGLPSGIERLLGITPGELSVAERDEVEGFLVQLGIPAAPHGNVLHSRCPLKAHASKKTYVNRRGDGAISVVCLGGHGGLGRRSWTEQDLLLLARGE